jgi:hypothetical protein
MGLKQWWVDRGGQVAEPEPEPTPTPSGNTLTLEDVVDNYEVLSVNDGLDGSAPYIVVTERGGNVGPFGYNKLAERLPDENTAPVVLAENVAGPAMVDNRELGSSAPSPFTSFTRTEYNQELLGLKGLQKYDQMRRSDGTVRGTLRALKTPVLSARWFVQPASDSDRDKKVAEFVWKCMTEYMSISWTQVLTESLLMAEFGYYMFEKVWETRIIKGQRRTVWQKLAPRHPMDVKKWYFDEHGGPAGVAMYSPYGTAEALGNFVPTTVNGRPASVGSVTDAFGRSILEPEQDILIPIKKLLVFSFDREASNIEGISALRSAYKHWYYKEQLYKIDAIQKERHGIGIPVIKLPVNFSAADRSAAEDLGRNLRTNERAHVVLPPNWELLFAKLEGNPVNAMTSIEHHDGRIRENILAAFMSDKTSTKEEDQTMFLKATRFIADVVADTFNMYAIPELVDLNFSRGVGYPRLRARRIGETEDQRTMSFTVRNLVGAGVIIPDDSLDDYMRDVLDLPERDPSTARPTQIMIQQEQFELQKKAQADAAAAAKEAARNPPPQQQVGPDGQPIQQDPQTRQRGADHAGLPRQQPTPPSGPPRSNAGTDRSGK